LAFGAGLRGSLRSHQPRGGMWRCPRSEIPGSSGLEPRGLIECHNPHVRPTEM
jgi:hypothetical protein